MNKQEAIDAINEFMQVLFTDYPAATQLMSDEIVWENFLPAHIPFGGRYEGASGIKTYLDIIGESWGVGEIVFHDFIYDPETRIMATPGVEKNGTAHSTGRTCDMDYMWEFRFTEAGKFSYIREYNDTAAIGGVFDQ